MENHSGELTVMKAVAEVPLFPGTAQMDGVIYKVKMKWSTIALDAVL